MSEPITDPEVLKWMEKMAQAFEDVTARTGHFQLYGGPPNYQDFLWLKDLPPSIAIAVLLCDRARQAANSRIDRIEVALSRIDQGLTVH